jgi:hypothetical protein
VTESRAVRASAIWRFISSGMEDADRRMRRMTRREPEGEPLAGVLQQSAAVRTVETLVARVAAARATSRLLPARAAAGHWPSRLTRAQCGTALIVAALTHVALIAAAGDLVTWLALVLPAIVLSAGLMLLAAGAAGVTSGGSART